MPKPVDMDALLLEQMKAGNKTTLDVFAATDGTRAAVLSFMASMQTSFAEVRALLSAQASAFASALAPFVSAIQQAVASAVGGEPRVQPPAGEEPKADAYGLKADTASGDESTYGLKEPIERPSTMAPDVPDAPEVPTLQEASVGDQFAKALEPATGHLSLIASRVEEIYGTTQAIESKAGGGDNGGGKKKDKPDADGKGIGEALGTVAVAAGLVVGSLGAITAIATGFVDALNPALMIPLNMAFKDLSAVVGTALTPIIAGATEIVRAFADMLVPVMAQLQPVIQSLTQVFVNLSGVLFEGLGRAAAAFMPLVEMVADVLKSMAPLVEVVFVVAEALRSALNPILTALVGVFQIMLQPILMMAEYLKSMEPLFKVFEAVMAGAAAAIKAFVGGIMGDSGVDQLKDQFADLSNSMTKFSQQLILAIASFAKMLGMSKFLEGFAKALEPAQKGTSTGMAAITNTKTSDFASFAKEMALNSAKAGMGAADIKPAAKTPEILEGIKGKLDEIINGKESKLAKETIDAIIKAAKDMLREQFPGTAKAYDKASEVARSGWIGAMIPGSKVFGL